MFGPGVESSGGRLLVRNTEGIAKPGVKRIVFRKPAGRPRLFPERNDSARVGGNGRLS